MLVPYINSNTSELINITKATTEEFSRLTYNGNEAFIIIYIP